MKTFALLVLIIIPFVAARAQIAKINSASADTLKSVKLEFKKPGEQEDYWAEQLFKNEYKREDFERYKGHVIINGDTYRYNTQVLSVYNIKPELRQIFEKGIFYPGIFTKNNESLRKTKIRIIKLKPISSKQPDSTMISQKLFYNMTRTDSLSIENFEELKFLDTRPQQKRFRFWLSRFDLANPTVYFMELINEKATAKTDLKTFIDGATLTFFKGGWIII